MLLTGLAGCKSVAVIEKSQAALNGIELGQAKQTVVKKLGAPINVIDLEGHQDSLFEYENINVYFFDDEVDELYTSESSACTALNVCPGSALTQVRAAYGRAAAKYKHGKKIVTYYLTDSDCWIEFIIEGSAVAAINEKCPA